MKILFKFFNVQDNFYFLIERRPTVINNNNLSPVPVMSCDMAALASKRPSLVITVNLIDLYAPPFNRYSFILIWQRDVRQQVCARKYQDRAKIWMTYFSFNICMPLLVYRLLCLSSWHATGITTRCNDTWNRSIVICGTVLWTTFYWVIRFYLSIQGSIKNDTSTQNIFNTSLLSDLTKNLMFKLYNVNPFSGLVSWQ